MCEKSIYSYQQRPLGTEKCELCSELLIHSMDIGYPSGCGDRFHLECLLKSNNTTCQTCRKSFNDIYVYRQQSSNKCLTFCDREIVRPQKKQTQLNDERPLRIEKCELCSQFLKNSKKIGIPDGYNCGHRFHLKCLLASNNTTCITCGVVFDLVHTYTQKSEDKGLEFKGIIYAKQKLEPQNLMQTEQPFQNNFM